MPESFIFDWFVPNYRQLRASTKCAHSQNFTFEGRTWCIAFDAATIHPGIFLKWQPNEESAAPAVRFSIGVIHPTDAVKSFGCMLCTMTKFNIDKPYQGWKKFCNENAISDDFINPDGSLHLKVFVTSDLDASLDTLANEPGLCYQSAALSGRFNVLSKMYRSGYMSDLDVLVGDKVFYCHKNILTAASSQIRNLVLEQPDEQKICIEDVSPVIFKILLDYIYGEQIRITATDNRTPNQLLFELLITANKLNIVGVGMAVCINDRNSGVLMNAAVLNKDTGLMGRCLQHIMQSSRENGRFRLCSLVISNEGLILIIKHVVDTYAEFLSEPSSAFKTEKESNATEMFIQSVIAHVLNHVAVTSMDADVTERFVHAAKPLFKRLDPTQDLESGFRYDTLLCKIRNVNARFMEAIDK